MEALYGGGEGQVYKQCMQWLDGNIIGLKTLGALAVGNFGRNGQFLPFICSKRAFVVQVVEHWTWKLAG